MELLEHKKTAHISRLIVHKDIKSDLLKKIGPIKRLENWDPIDPKTTLGALIDKEHCKKF